MREMKEAHGRTSERFVPLAPHSASEIVPSLASEWTLRVGRGWERREEGSFFCGPARR